METLLEKPSKKDRAAAKLYVGEFERLLQKGADGDIVTLLVEGSAVEFKLPKRFIAIFSAALHQIAEGHDVTILQGEDQLSTQQAADYLQVSRPHLVKLLEQGEIPFTLVGTHRRMLVSDVEAYKQKQLLNRQKQLIFLAQQAQELNLGY
jgi:excisionase family DNA binding protein